jgi:phage head maturation protease
MDDTLIMFGGEVKAREVSKELVEFKGYLVLFGDKDNTDLSQKRDFFTPETDFDLEFSTKSRVLYDHGLDAAIGKTKLGHGTLETKAAGTWIEAQLARRDKYEQYVDDLYSMSKKGKLGWSSGVPGHLVDREEQDNGANKILTWPLGLDASLTPEPAEPRTLACVKSLQAYQSERKSSGLSTDNKREILQRALMTKLKEGLQENEYFYAWIQDVYDKTVVWCQDDGCYEATYVLDGLTATFGEPSKVQRIVSYKPLSDGSTKTLIATERDFESFLREAGFSKSQALAITASGYKAFGRRDSDRQTDTAALDAALQAYVQTEARLTCALQGVPV